MCCKLKLSQIDYETTPLHDLLLSDFNLWYNLMNKPLFECAITYKKICRHWKKKKKLKNQELKNQDIKEYLTQRIIQKIFKNQKIHYLEIIETK